MCLSLGHRSPSSRTRLSQWQHFVDCAGFFLQSLTFLSENKEWACDSSCIFLLMFINRRLKYLLHGDTSRRCYGLYNNYLLSVFYNLVNFIYPLYLEFGNKYVTWSLGFRELCFVLYRVLVSVSFFFFIDAFVEFAPWLHCGYFIAIIGSYFFFCI